MKPNWFSGEGQPQADPLQCLWTSLTDLFKWAPQEMVSLSWPATRLVSAESVSLRECILRHSEALACSIASSHWQRRTVPCPAISFCCERVPCEFLSCARSRKCHFCMSGQWVVARLASLWSLCAPTTFRNMTLCHCIGENLEASCMTFPSIPWRVDNDTNIFGYICVHSLDSPIGALLGGNRPRRCTSCTVIVQCPSLPLWYIFVHCMAVRTFLVPPHLASFHSAYLLDLQCSNLPARIHALSPFRGVRIGEAKNPGPHQQLLSSYFGQVPRTGRSSGVSPLLHNDAIVIAVVNPTSVLNKTNELLSLKSDIIVLSETSAVARTQQLMSAALRKNNYRVLWGDAVSSHCHEGRQADSLRGLAAGVALATTLPAFLPQTKPSPELLASCRYMEANVRVGPLTIRFITLYGRPSCQVGAREANQQLLQAAYEQVATTRMPTIIAGDLNAPVDSLPAGQNLLARGFKEAFYMHRALHHETLPPTCKGSTRNDTLLLDPILLPFFERAWVLKEEKLFDAHDPLCVQLKIPHAIPCTRRWNLPHSWSQHEPDPKILSDFYMPFFLSMRRQIEDCKCGDTLSQAFQDWASGIEDAVHSTLQKQHSIDPVKHPLPGLPKRARGRCKPQTPILRPAVQCARPSRAGDFAPDHDATTVLARMKVRQVRRVESLLRACRSRERNGQSTAQDAQLISEWSAVKAARGYPPCFSSWILRTAHFVTFPVQVPPVSWLEDVLTVRLQCLGCPRVCPAKR